MSKKYASDKSRSSSQGAPVPSQKKWPENIASVLVSVIASFIVSAVVFYGTMSRELGGVTESLEFVKKSVEPLNGMDGLYSRFSSLSTTADRLSDDVNALNDSIENINNHLNTIDNRLDKIESLVHLTAINITDGDMNPDTFVGVVPNSISAVTSSYVPDTYVGTDAGGRNYTVEDISSRPVLLTYSEAGLEVYFFGQLNETYHWDGFCITNAYREDGSLYSICESDFENGTRIKFKSFYQTDDNETEWIYTDRVCGDDGNFGTSRKFQIENKIKKNFDSDAVQLQDILYINGALAACDKTLLSYYHGRTSEGSYNDMSGTAYYLRYDDRERVKTLYIGGFQNGNFHDQSGNAIELIYDGRGYFRYKGKFTSGKRDGNVSGKDYVGQEEILKIIQDTKINFEVKLNWITD